MSQEDTDYSLSAPVCSAKLMYHMMNNIKAHQVSEWKDYYGDTGWDFILLQSQYHK